MEEEDEAKGRASWREKEGEGRRWLVRRWGGRWMSERPRGARLTRTAWMHGQREHGGEEKTGRRAQSGVMMFVLVLFASLSVRRV